MSASPNLKCGLCNEFLVNAVTVAGCMHSFCEECLLKSLSVSGICPTKGCKKNVDKNGYRRDSTLQMLVYKFMPQMFFESAEKSKGRVDVSNVKTQRELAQASAEICDPNELLSICLEFVPAPAVARPDEDPMSLNPSTSTAAFKAAEPPAKKSKKAREHCEVQQSFRRFFRCAAKVPIRTVRRLLETKLFLTDQFSVHFISDRDFQDIPDDVTLRTLVLDGGFDRTRPFRLFFTLIPTVVDDAPPVLDAEMMPCLMPEAPVHQEAPSTMQPSGQLQPVQIVSPVVPALTVSLSTDIYGHSAPIITPQCAPRKRRKLSDPKKSPTERSPTTAPPQPPPPPPIAPNMLVGPLLRPMFIAQSPFMHRSPPNMHIQMPFPQPPQNGANPVERSPSKRPTPAPPRHEIDQPPRLQREDPVIGTVPPPTLEPSISSSASSITNIERAPAPAPADVTPMQLHHQQQQPMMPPRLEPSQQVVPLPPTSQHHHPTAPAPPPLPSSHAADRSSTPRAPKAEKNTKKKPPPGSAATPSASSEHRPMPKLTSSQVHQENPPHPLPPPPPPHPPQPLPAGPPLSQQMPYLNGVLKGYDSPPRLESMAAHSNRPQQSAADKKQTQPPRANPGQQNGVMTSAPRLKQMAASPATQTPPELQSRPVQTVLPQPLSVEFRTMQQMLPTKLATSTPPPPTAPPPPQPQPLPPQQATNAEMRRSDSPSVRTSNGSVATDRDASPSMTVPSSTTKPVSAGAPATATTTSSSSSSSSSAVSSAPMDFRRMATLNKQSLGRTLQAVLASGRVANTADSTASAKGTAVTTATTTSTAGATTTATVTASADVKSPSLSLPPPPPINGKIKKDGAVDLHFSSSKSLSI